MSTEAPALEGFENPIPPSIRGGVREWNQCIDHDLYYLGVGGPDWHRHHMWICLDEAHDRDRETFIFGTDDGSGKIQFADGGNQETNYLVALNIRRLVAARTEEGRPQ